MIIPDKRKAISVIMSKIGKDGRPQETEVASESGPMDEYTALAEDLLAAVASKSKQKVASVLRSYHDMIKGEDEEQDMGG